MNGNRWRLFLKVVLGAFSIGLAALLVHAGNVSVQQRRDAALYEAVYRSDQAAVLALLREHADPNVRAPVSFSWDFWRPHASGFRASALRTAIEQAVVDSFRAGPNRTPADSGQAIVIALLDAGAHAAPDDGGQNLLEWTLSSGSHRLPLTTEALLKHGAPLPSTLSGQPLLAGAIHSENSPETIDVLLHAGADAKGEVGRAALIAAYNHWEPSIPGHQDALAILRSLLKAGADPNTPIGRSTMLYDALRWQHSQVVPLLLEAHADPNAAPPGELPLLYVALEDAPEVLQWVLDAGADPNVREQNGEPVLWYAVIHSMSEPAADKARKVELLLQHGANVHVRFATTEYGPMTIPEAAHRGAKDYRIDPAILTLLDRATGSTKQPR
jgi:ankyrin repeat protein